ncbi:MAG: ThiF family adenylyltransferase, partial [Nanoarchaeota archaeon]
MRILCLGIGALGSNLCANLAADSRGELDITVLDFDNVEERNLRGTQYYFPEQEEQFKSEALQYSLYKHFNKEITIITEKLTDENISLLSNFNLIVDTFDNFQSRKLVQDYCISH